MADSDLPVLKIILLGDSAVGKSTVLVRYTEGKFVDTAITVGVDFKIHDLSIDGATYRLQIWDTAGQEKFRGIVEAYYRRAQGILLLYDQTCSSSFDSLPDWLVSIHEHAAPNIPVVIAGNKDDLDPVISFERGNAFAQSQGLSYVPTSAALGIGIDEAFLEVAKLIVKKQLVPDEVKLDVAAAAAQPTGGCHC
jgi:small GTP-binding protein